MPKVLNKYKDFIPSDAVYIGRGSPYGNPFLLGKDGDRSEVIDRYREYLYSNKELLDKIINELKGKDLVCFCKPKKCHGDILIEIANYEELW